MPVYKLVRKQYNISCFVEKNSNWFMNYTEVDYLWANGDLGAKLWRDAAVISTIIYILKFERVKLVINGEVLNSIVFINVPS